MRGPLSRSDHRPSAETAHVAQSRPKAAGTSNLGPLARGAAPPLLLIMRPHDEGGLCPLVACGIERAEGHGGFLQGEGVVFLALESTRSVPAIQEYGCSAERVSRGDRRGRAPGPYTEPCPET